MAGERESSDEIKLRIGPILDNVAVDGLRAWLKSVDLPSAAYTKAAITELVSKQIASGLLSEEALREALIGFEEASDMRIYLFRMEDPPSGAPERWLPTRLVRAGFAPTKVKAFAGGREKPMSPVYAHFEGGLLRVKWAEKQQRTTVNDRGNGVDYKDFFKRVVLVADFHTGFAELRLNAPENVHSYVDAGGRPTSGAYYSSYKEKAEDLLGFKLAPMELRPVVRQLVEKEDPRVIRIHIDTHTNQSNNRMKVNASQSDIRDDPDWQLAYKRNGSTWAWEAQSFYWLPRVSSGLLTREVFTHIDANEGYGRVNADCSDKEVTYVVSQLRKREAT